MNNIDYLVIYDKFKLILEETKKILDEDYTQNRAADGVKNQLNRLIHRLNNTYSLNVPNENNPKLRIGVFGVPKRGKSKLMNALIGEDILPVNAIPCTSTVIEIEKSAKKELMILQIDNNQILYKEDRLKEVNDLKQILAKYADMKKAKLVKKITVKWPFDKMLFAKKVFDSVDSEIANNIMLIDTPGAELAFLKSCDTSNQKELEEIYSSAHNDDNENIDSAKQYSELIEEITREKQNEHATNLTIDSLNQTNVLLYCARGDLGGYKLDVEFYEKNIKNKHHIFVINFRDLCDNCSNTLKRFSEDYDIGHEDLMFVSAKDALNVILSKKQSNNEEHIKELEDKFSKSKISELLSKISEEVKKIKDLKLTLYDLLCSYNKILELLIHELKANKEVIIPSHCNRFNFIHKIYQVDDEKIIKIMDEIIKKTCPTWENNCNKAFELIKNLSLTKELVKIENDLSKVK